MFVPNVQTMATVIRIQHRVETTAADGFRALTWQDAAPAIHLCDAKVKASRVVEVYRTDRALHRDVLTLTMWYDAGVKATDRILLNDDSALLYEVVGTPENVNMRGQYMILTVERMADS